MVRIKYDTKGIDDAAERLGVLAERMRDLRALFEGTLEQTFYNAERELFASEGRVGGPGWRPLNPEYAAWKARNFPGQPILQRTGALYSSLTTRGAPGQYRQITDRTMELGSSLPHSDYVDHTRPIISQAPVTDTAWARACDSFLASVVREAGL